MTTTGDVRTAIEEGARRFSAVYASGDASELARLYTVDGQLLPAGLDAVRGHAGIEQFWQSAMDMGIKSAELEVLEVEGFRDLAFDVGQYVLKGADGNVLDRGKYIVIWKREDGGWKMHRDIWTTSIKQ